MINKRESEFKPKSKHTSQPNLNSIDQASKSSYASMQYRGRGASVTSNKSGSSVGKKSVSSSSDFYRPIISPKSSALGTTVRSKSKKNVFKALVDDAYEKELRIAQTQKKYAQNYKNQVKKHK